MEGNVRNGKLEPPSLDQRVAAVLTSDNHHPSETLSALIAEVDDAIDEADQAGREARDAAANPKVLDAGARGRAEDAEHTAHRLRNGMAALKQLETEALAREYEEKWSAEADDVELAVVRAADELLKRYPAVTSWITEFFTRKIALDKEVMRINGSAPLGSSRRLKEVELVARAITDWGPSQPIDKQLKLPALVVGSQSTAPLLWPPIQQISVGLVQGLFPRNGSVESPVHGVQRFELIDGVIRAIGANGEVLESIAVDQPVVPALHPEMTLREQALAEEPVRTAEAARHAEEGRARERERQRRNDERENAEFMRRQEAISR
jgi:hypothetical protein